MWGWLRGLPLLGAIHRHSIPPDLWARTQQACAYLEELSLEEQSRLRELSELFLARKEFHGAHGLEVTDAMAVAIAVQACLPILHFGPKLQPLRWYDDFVGIVIHPVEARARREVMDDAGVVHHFDEIIAGEAMAGGPVMLSWQDVARADRETGYNVVIHEFVHKLDLRDGQADGCPPLPSGFMGTASAGEARQLWLEVISTAYTLFREQVIRAERFGGDPTWLDSYGAQAIDEFFAVASEAYFVNRERFTQEFGTLRPLFDAFYRPRI